MALPPTNLQGTTTATKLNVLEGIGNIDNTYSAVPSLAETHGTNPQILASMGKWTAKLSKDGTDYSNNPKVGQPKDVGNPNDSAVKRATDTKNSKNSTHTQMGNPTAASQDKNKKIVPASLAADPQNIVGAVQKALKAMMMLLMIDGLTSSGGVNSMASGSLGSALSSISGQIGMQPTLSTLSSAMPLIANTLSNSQITILNEAITGLLSNSGVGALSNDSIDAAQNVASSITYTNTSSNVVLTINTAATIGGVVLGLDINSLAAQIANAVVGSVITTNTMVGNVLVITTTEITSAVLHADLENIPSLTGLEAVEIAANTAEEIVALLLPIFLAANNTDANTTANAISNAISSSVSSIQDKGLQTVLGSSLGNMLSQATQLVPLIGAQLQEVPTIHVPNTVLSSGAMNNLLNNATKTLGIATMVSKIAAMFSNTQPEQVQQMQQALTSLVGNSPLGTTLSISTPSGATITSTNKTS